MLHQEQVGCLELSYKRNKINRHKRKERLKFKDLLDVISSHTCGVDRTCVLLLHELLLHVCFCDLI
ncbi:hypothetical protein HanLR1_Chr15g0574381 [Helianthus annuus]|nr:hypothetical protein HanLR1_Chr15g0574381 [Helianthus annuus]